MADINPDPSRMLSMAGSYLKFDGFQGKNMETAKGFWSMFPQSNPMTPLGVLKNEVYQVYPQISNMIGKMLINYIFFLRCLIFRQRHRKENSSCSGSTYRWPVHFFAGHPGCHEAWIPGSTHNRPGIVTIWLFNIAMV